jgi:hypothetical protein
MIARAHRSSSLRSCLRVAVMAAGVLSAVWACDSGTGVGPATTDKPAALIDIRTTQPALLVGDNDVPDDFDVTNPDFAQRDGNNADRLGRLIGVTVVWTSSDPTVVAVATPTTVTGAAKTVLDDEARQYGTKLMLRGLKTGTATVTGTVTGAPTVDNAPVTTTLTVTVTPAPTKLVATPKPVNVLLTSTPVLSAKVFAADGTAVPATPFWTCSDTLVAVVRSSSFGGHCGEPSRISGMIGDTTTIGGDVVLTPKKAGTMRLIATYKTTFQGASRIVADTVTVTVSSGVAKVVVTPASANLVVGGLRVLSANALDAAGNVITGLPVTWGSRNTSVLSVDAAGQAKGLTSGTGPGLTATANAFATIGGVSGDAVLTVYRTPAVVVSPTPNTLVLNQTVTLHAKLVDSDNTTQIPFSAASVNWTSDNAAIAKVTTVVDDSTATVTALAVGATQVRATSGLASGIADIKVNATAAATSLVVFVQTGATTMRPAVRTNEPVTVGGTLQLVTEVRDVNGALLVDQVVYTSSNTAVATVDATTGLVTAKSVGIAQITSKSTLNPALSSTVAVNVSAASTSAPASLKITPSTVTVHDGGTQQFTATLYDASGNVTTVPSGGHIGFAVDDSNVAETTATGLVTAYGTGSTFVRAFLVLANNQQTNISAAATLTVVP